MSMAERIKQKRQERQLTQDDMEQLTGIDQGYLSLIENGKRKRVSAELLVKIARALDCTVEDLMAARLQPAAA